MRSEFSGDTVILFRGSVNCGRQEGGKMEEIRYVPVGVESIEPDMFPDVALYLKSGGNYVLYKSHGRDFRKKDAERLMENKVEFLYVSPGDMEVITEYMESNAERFLKSDDFDSKAKGKMIYQTSINFVNDIFFNPQKSGDLDRSKRLIENLLTYITGDTGSLAFLETVINHNYFTFVHSLQVTTLCLMVHSEAYMLSRDELMDVGIGTLLHDVGAIFVPQEILTKKARLTEAEVERYKRHPEDGYNFLRENTRLNDVALAIVRNHHERLNGNGYPHGLKGEQISRSAQVAAICDFYCNMTIDREGNKTLPPHICMNIMKQEMKGAFNDRLLGFLEELVCTGNADMGQLPL
jgi:HD-GYP domain-containing protein (c-di-GMP phosphodiesterase class II)